MLVAQSCPILRGPMDCLLCSWDSPGKQTGVNCHSSPEDLSDPGIEPGSPALRADSLRFEPPRKPRIHFKKCLNRACH